MSRKDLTSHSTMPQLLSHYLKAHETLFNIKPYVHKKHYGRFSKFELRLHKEGIVPRDYAYGIIPLLDWARKKHNTETIPLNLFLGVWALTEYKAKCDVHFEKVTTTESDAGELLQAERMAVQYFIASKQEFPTLSFAEAVEELRPMLPADWWTMYKHGGRLELEVTVLDELYDQYGYLTSYDDIQLQSGV